MGKRLNILYIILLPLLAIGMYSESPLFPICILLIFLRLFFTNKETAGFYLLLFGGTIAGLTRAYFPQIPIYGIFFDILGLLLFNDFKDCFKRQSLGITSLIALIFLFLVSYLIGDHTEYANNKIIQIIIRGFTLFFAYYVFDRSKKIDIECLTQLLLINTIAMITFTTVYYSFNVGDIFNYDWFRTSCEQWAYQNQESILGDYQKVGMYAAFAAGLYTALKRPNTILLLYYNIIAAQLILTSGCRQALLALIAILFLRFVFFTNAKGFIKKVFSILGSFIVLYFIYDTIINSDASTTLTRTLESGDTGRYMIYIGAINLFLTNFLFGVGLGGFPIYVNIPLVAPWPHNIILEILCECGLVGFILISLVVINFVAKSHISLKYLTSSGCYLFLFLIAILIRIMVSGDLTNSIEIFSALFACPSQLLYNKASIKNMLTHH